MSKTLGISFCVLFLGGCMVGPEYERPTTVTELAGGYVNRTDVEDPNELDSMRWWEHFADPVTSDLVEAALANNTDLRAAAAGVVESEALLAAAYGARLPSVDYGFTRVRNKISFNLPEPTGRVSFISQTYEQNLNIVYMADVFGKLRRAERAALDDLLATEANRQALVHAIVSQVVRLRIEIATQQRLLELANDNLENWQRSLEIIDRRYQQGLTSPLDVYLAQENLASAKAQKTSIEQMLALTYHGLDVLLGQAPGTTAELERSMPLTGRPETVPVGLPGRLLDRRPDVKAAEMRLAAATERVGVSIARMYPDLTLTASGGYASDSFRLVTATENQVYSAVMAVAMPVFRGGQLKAGVRAARARVEKAAAEYAGVILTAMREVEDALIKERKIAERAGELEERLEHARQAERLARQRYGEGVENILIVLETERRRKLAENERAVAQGNLWNARVDLMLALGGDWGTRAQSEKLTKSISDNIK